MDAKQPGPWSGHVVRRCVISKRGKKNYAHLPRAIDPALKKVHFKAILILYVERAGAHVRIYARLITLAKLRLQPSGRSVAAASPPACRSVLA